MIDFSFSSSQVTLNPGAMNLLLHETNGPVGMHLRKRGLVIMAAARRQVGVDTGMLRLSIRMIHTREVYGQALKIGSTNSIALLHHEGTRPHLILPRGHYALRFSAGGRIIYTRKVMHPGTRPNKYLSDNLILVRV